MPSVTVELPSLLRRFAGDAATVALEAGTVREALDALVALHPTLAVHLFDGGGDLRQHVLCFHNETNTRWLPDLDVALEPGDRITIMQAVSGG
jgi:molybdopterin converting factor small subunit